MQPAQARGRQVLNPSLPRLCPSAPGSSAAPLCSGCHGQPNLPRIHGPQRAGGCFFCPKPQVANTPRVTNLVVADDLFLQVGLAITYYYDTPGNFKMLNILAAVMKLLGLGLVYCQSPAAAISVPVAMTLVGPLLIHRPRATLLNQRNPPVAMGGQFPGQGLDAAAESRGKPSRAGSRPLLSRVGTRCLACARERVQ